MKSCSIKAKKEKYIMQLKLEEKYIYELVCAYAEKVMEKI